MKHDRKRGERKAIPHVIPSEARNLLFLCAPNTNNKEAHFSA
jgi:hypothetical protein